jgi:6-phosphogluconolactonase (cycloisomerase 2 family)
VNLDRHTQSVLCIIIVILNFTKIVQAKSVYVISNTEDSNVAAYKIQGTTLTHQVDYICQSDVSVDTGAVGVAVDESEYGQFLFVTFEDGNLIELVNAKAMQYVDAVVAPQANNLAGIVVNKEKSKVYVVNRFTNHLYVYSWNAEAKTLTLDLPDPYYVELQDSYEAYGIAFDYENNRLYVADDTNTIKCYDANDPNWSKLEDFTFSITDTAVGIAVDVNNQHVYTGASQLGSSTYITKYDLGTDSEDREDRNDVGSPVLGIAVDQETSLVYLTTYETGELESQDRLMIYDSNLVKQSWESGDIGNPAGVAVGGLYKPPYLSLAEGYEVEPNDPCDANDCARPGDSIIYTISYDANGYSVNDVSITDYLPYEVSNSPNDVNFSEPNGAYDPGTHTVVWEVGNLDANDSGAVTVTVKVNKLAAPNGVIANFCEMESGSTYNTAEVHTAVCWWCGSIIYVDANAPTDYKSGGSWQSAYKDLQDALETAEKCDCNEIWVAEGTYKPTVPSTDATFEVVEGVAIYGGFGGSETSVSQRNRIANETILDGDDDASYVVTGRDVSGSAIIDGFTIKNGTGSGIYCESGSPRVTNCKITENGYGVDAWSGVSITKCIIHGNAVHGMWAYAGNPVIKNNWIYKNGADGSGDGIRLDSLPSQTVVRNNTIVGNAGYGICGSTSHHISNCIVRANGQEQVYDCNASYSCIQGVAVYPGIGNINSDPCFVYADANNYHLDPNSACIDRGDPCFADYNETDIEGETRLFDGDGNGIDRIDMGADEFYWSPADFNEDKIVNFVDYAMLRDF